MMPCPYCGTPNSTSKRVCYHCQADIAPATAKTAARATGAPARDAKKQAAQAARAARDKKPRPGGIDFLIGVSLRQRAQFYRQLFSLLNSGIPIGLGLNYSASNCAIQLRQRINKMAAFVQKGGLLSDAMAQYPGVFPSWEVSVVYAAEKGGTLPQAMRDIADALEMEWDLRMRTRTATFHLKVTAFVFVLVLLIVMNVQSGTFDVVLTSVGGAFIKFFLILALLFVLWLGWRYFAKTRSGSRFVAAALPRVPIIGGVLANLIRIRFVRVLATLWHAGVPPLESLAVAARTTDNAHFVHQIEKVSGAFSQGVMLSSVLAETRFLPQESLYLLQTGETSGNVAESLEKIAEYYSIELDAQVKTLPIKLQMLLYAIIVPFVLWLLIKFYGGMYGGAMTDMMNN
ncbi:MAG TPA: type II secretion system F family protein [Armatimonadota bacterium]|jgi:type IV pilus assembly protein PilC